MHSPTKRAPRKLPADVKLALTAAVQRLKSQSKAASDLGVSSAVVSALINDKYVGDVDTMADRIRGQYMAETVTCPVMGTLGKRSCLDYQANPRHTNPMTSALAAACKTCEHRKEPA
jgi:hypothetical protein